MGPFWVGSKIMYPILSMQVWQWEEKNYMDQSKKEKVCEMKPKEVKCRSFYEKKDHSVRVKTNLRC